MGETGPRCDEHEGDGVGGGGTEVGGGRMDDAGATASEHQSVTPTHQHCASPPTLYHHCHHLIFPTPIFLSSPGPIVDPLFSIIPHLLNALTVIVEDRNWLC